MSEQESKFRVEQDLYHTLKPFIIVDIDLIQRIWSAKGFKLQGKGDTNVVAVLLTPLIDIQGAVHNKAWTFQRNNGLQTTNPLIALPRFYCAQWYALSAYNVRNSSNVAQIQASDIIYAVLLGKYLKQPLPDYWWTLRPLVSDLACYITCFYSFVFFLPCSLTIKKYFFLTSNPTIK